MNDKDNKKNGSSYDLMQDTQYLLLGLDETAGESYAIEDILAEFSGDESFAPKKKDTKPQAAPAPHTENAEPERNPKIIAFPSAVVPPEENSDDTMVLIDMREYEEEPPVQELFSVSEQRAAREEPEEETN